MIHAYFTDGMFELAKNFLKSLYMTNGDTFHVMLSTRDLQKEQIEELYELYPSLHVENKMIDMEKFAFRAGVNVETLYKYKEDVEKNYVNNQNKVWKLMIAAEDRPRSLYDLLLRGEGTNSPIYHFDIDTIFVKDITPMIAIATRHDCCLLLRPHNPSIKARITISTMFWRRTPAVLKFFDRWMHYLDIMPPPMRPIGYGQTSCWYAYEEVKEELDCHKLSTEWGYPGKKMNKDSNYVWSGAVHKMKKTDFVKEIERLKGK